MLSYRDPIRQLRLLMNEAFFADGENYFHSAKAALQDCDLAVCHMVDFLGSEAAAQLGLPRIGGILAPAGIPTAYAVPPRMPQLGQWINPFMWKLVQMVLNRVDQEANAFLRRIGGPTVAVRGFHVLAPSLNLLACSPTLGPVFPDLPGNIEVMGPWILKENEFVPSSELVAFLERHPRPVMVSFGSMGGTKGPELTRTVLAALKLCGKPAIIQSGYSGMFAQGASDRIHFADFVPHEWLFPHASCVVHHAGAGTTTAVARAGVPHVPVTFIADQPYFAGNLRRLGVASKLLWYHAMKPGNLARRIVEVCDNPAVQARARALQPVIRAEEGNVKTVERIGRFVRDLGL
jgi:sterol 3beta-glucosyltransferase